MKVHGTAEHHGTMICLMLLAWFLREVDDAQIHSTLFLIRRCSSVVSVCLVLFVWFGSPPPLA